MRVICILKQFDHKACAYEASCASYKNRFLIIGDVVFVHFASNSSNYQKV